MRETTQEPTAAAADGSASLELVDTQSAQQRIVPVELTHTLWTKKTLITAYIGLFLTTFVLYLEIYSTGVYFPYVTSEFSSHSMLTTAGIIQNIADVASYPIVAKLSDVFGRAEGLTLSILFSALANALAAGSNNIETYVASNIFEAMGNAGFTIMQQVFIADTTRLVNRGIWSSLVEAVCVIPVLYLGTIIGESMLTNASWRWGYGMWAIIVPVMAIPLIYILYHNQRRSRHLVVDRKWGLLADVPEGASWLQKTIHVLWVELDILGIFFLIAGLTLTLVPLSITGVFSPQRWEDGSTIAMIVIGIVLLIAFFVWDARFAVRPLFPYRMVKDRTVTAAIVLAFVDWMGYATGATLLSSYFQVAAGFSPGHAVRIDNAGRVTFQVASVFVGFLMRWTKRSQPFVLLGIPIAILAQGILIYMVNIDGERTANEASFVTSRVLAGIGRAFFSTASQISIQASVLPQDVAVATGIFLAAMSVGSSVGRSIAGAIWNQYLPLKLEQNLPAEAVSEAPQIFASFVYAMEFPAGSPVREAINLSYRETTQILAIAATSIMVAMLGIQFLLRNIDLAEADAGRQKRLANATGLTSTAPANTLEPANNSAVPDADQKTPQVSRTNEPLNVSN